MEELLLELVTAGLLAVIGWIDGRTMEIPYALSGALAICALADFFLFPGLPVGERLMGMVCVSVPMYTLCMVVKEAFPACSLAFCWAGWRRYGFWHRDGQSLGRGPIWPLARPCAWDLGSACFMERGSFSGMRGFLAEYAQGDVYYGRY